MIQPFFISPMNHWWKSLNTRICRGKNWICFWKWVNFDENSFFFQEKSKFWRFVIFPKVVFFEFYEFTKNPKIEQTKKVKNIKILNFFSFQNTKFHQIVIIFILFFNFYVFILIENFDFQVFAVQKHVSLVAYGPLWNCSKQCGKSFFP